MNERIEELRKQVDVDMHLHNLEDFRAMSGCFGLEGGNKIVDDYLDKFAELIVRDCATKANATALDLRIRPELDARKYVGDCILKCFGVEE